MSTPNKSTLIGAVIAGLIGGLTSMSALLLFGAYPDLTARSSYTGLIKFIHDWQTLIAGIIALAAALMTVHTIRKQTFNAREIFDEQIAAEKKRQHAEKTAHNRLAMASVPHALMEIINYLEKQWEHWEKVVDSAKPNQILYFIFAHNLPKPPLDALEKLHNACLYPQNEEIGNSIAMIIRNIQILERTLKLVSRENSSTANPGYFLRKIVEIRHLTSVLFQHFDETYSELSFTEEQLLKCLESIVTEQQKPKTNSAAKILAEDAIKQACKSR
ncbi:MAG: hypothetical protein VX620_01650 [Pseudomonadota bacterium]|nr:hypothetical protein [Pseudomonadota bacterium]